VRVKQRAMRSEDRTETERDWDDLKLSLIALLIAWKTPVSLKLKDSNSRRIMTLTGRGASEDSESEKRKISSSATFKSQQLSQMLFKSGYFSSATSMTWVPASASSKALSIKGTIALEPAPTRRLQFISLDHRPLFARDCHNELYEHVDRLFKRSRFGVVDHAEARDPNPRLSALSGREKLPSPGKKDSRSSRKGPDRWPVFYLRISPKPGSDAFPFDDASSLDTITKVLDALILGWLNVNHFKPTPRSGNRRKRSPDSESETTDAGDDVAAARGRSSSSHTSQLRVESRKRKRVNSGLPPVEIPCESSGATTAKNVKSRTRLVEQLDGSIDADAHSLIRPRIEGNSSAKPSGFILRLQDGPSDLPCGDRMDVDKLEPSTPPTVPKGTRPETSAEPAMDWEDPSTGQKHQVNPHTGMLVSSNASYGGEGAMAQNNTFRLTLRPGRRTDQPQGTGWVDKVLDGWKNPVFPCTEQGIRRASLETPESASDGRFSSCSGASIQRGLQRAFEEASLPGPNKLSKDALVRAKLISQIDNKFILVSLPQALQEDGVWESLVIIDQHAADERCKLEYLISELCASFDGDSLVVVSNLGLRSKVNFALLSSPLEFRLPPQEVAHFTTEASRFADWGILYDIESTPDPVSLSQHRHNLLVRTLPPVVAERLTEEPEILINILRTEVWKNVGTGRSLSRGDTEMTSREDEKHPWLRQIGTCPAGILDLLCSRACRSAIMFNDRLTTEECGALIESLAACAFPFQCAHGRPSMVPVIRIKDREGEKGSPSLFEEVESSAGADYVHAFQQWNQLKEEELDETTSTI
jgi:DNA mismatch repair protein MLH3